MKSKMLAWTAAILIVALVSAAFLRPAANENSDFLGVADLYGAPTFISVASSGGDTDLLKITAYAHTFVNGPEIIVRFESTTDVLLSAWGYSNGALTEFGDAVSGTDNATVDFMMNGEWRPMSRLGGFSQFEEPLAFRGEWEYTHHLGYEEPGTYRITYYFRELESYEPLDTLGPQHTVSFVLTIPELDAEKPDIYSVGMVDHPYWEPRLMTVSAIVRAPIGGYIYHDRRSARLEKRVGGVWVEAPAREGMPSAVESLPDEDDEYLVDGGTTSWASVRLYIVDYDARYRLLLDFYDTKHLLGEPKTLTLNLDFSEVVK